MLLIFFQILILSLIDTMLLGIISFINHQFFITTVSFKKQFIAIILGGTTLGTLSILLLFQLQNANAYTTILILIASNLLIYLGCTIFSKLLFQRTPVLQLFLLFCLAQVFMQILNKTFYFILITFQLYSDLTDYFVLILNLVMYFFIFLCTFFLIKIVKKFRMDTYLTNLFQHHYISATICFLFFILDLWLEIFAISSSLAIIITASGYFLMLIPICYLVYDTTKKAELISSQKNFEQQVIYSNHLEKTQKEIQAIHQNYKNIVEKLYHQALEQDTAAIKQTIQQEVIQVNQTVSQHLKQLNQLGRIEFLELKGLVLAKIMEAEKQGLNLFVEVQEPIEAISMKTADILRCLGILLDNAIEASIHAEQNFLTLLLLKENGVITIIVKNHLKNNPPLHQIWQEGYSTKGENRGLGLSNLRQIISNYHNVFQDTRIEQHDFIQILKIKNS